MIMAVTKLTQPEQHRLLSLREKQGVFGGGVLSSQEKKNLKRLRLKQKGMFFKKKKFFN